MSRCEADVWAGPMSTSPLSCLKPGKYLGEDGRHYCGVHDPKSKALRKEAYESQRRKELESLDRRVDRRNEEIRRKQRRVTALEELLGAAKTVATIISLDITLLPAYEHKSAGGVTVAMRHLRAAIKKVEGL